MFFTLSTGSPPPPPPNKQTQTLLDLYNVNQVTPSCWHIWHRLTLKAMSQYKRTNHPFLPQCKLNCHSSFSAAATWHRQTAQQTLPFKQLSYRRHRISFPRKEGIFCRSFLDFSHCCLSCSLCGHWCYSGRSLPLRFSHLFNITHSLHVWNIKVDSKKKQQ